LPICSKNGSGRQRRKSLRTDRAGQSAARATASTSNKKSSFTRRSITAMVFGGYFSVLKNVRKCSPICPIYVLDRLSRHEATLWRQTRQTLLAFDALDRRKPRERGCLSRALNSG
jgi:hypothetical protein